MISEIEVEVEDYEEVIGDLDYSTGVEAGQNAGSFQEPTLEKTLVSWHHRIDRP